jgi:hypothetical protein
MQREATKPAAPSRRSYNEVVRHLNQLPLVVVSFRPPEVSRIRGQPQIDSAETRTGSAYSVTAHARRRWGNGFQ